MKQRSKFRPRQIQVILMVLVWVLLISVPLASMDLSLHPGWLPLIKLLETIIPLMVTFLLNHFLLVPRLLFSGRPWSYGVLTAGLILAMSAGLMIWQLQVEQSVPRPPANLPPHLRSGMPGPLPPPGQRPVAGPLNVVPSYANLLLFSLLLVGMDTGLQAFVRLGDAERRREQLEKERVSHQLQALRNQVSPHFLMNTLNNIHALVEAGDPRSGEAVIRLSKLMRYLLYDTAGDVATLQQEVDFLDSYVELMRMRYADDVQVAFTHPEELPAVTLPTQLFTSVIENAFKHGVSYNHPSFVLIDLMVNSSALQLLVKNSRSPGKESEASGIGLENTRRRLELLYGSSFSFHIEETNTLFSVNIQIPLTPPGL